MADHVLDDLIEVVGEYAKREGSEPARSFYILLADQAIDEVSALIEGVEREWTNAANGGITLTDADAVFDSTLYQLESVRWNGVEIDEKTTQWFDRKAPDWRTSESTPIYYARTTRGLVLNCIPDVDATGLLTAYGMGSLPHFSEVAGAENPLAWLALPYQLSLQFYMLGNLPIPRSDRTDLDLRLMAEERARSRDKWAALLPFMAGGVSRRRTSRFEFEAVEI